MMDKENLNLKSFWTSLRAKASPSPRGAGEENTNYRDFQVTSATAEKPLSLSRYFGKRRNEKKEIKVDTPSQAKEVNQADSTSGGTESACTAETPNVSLAEDHLFPVANETDESVQGM